MFLFVGVRDRFLNVCLSKIDVDRDSIWVKECEQWVNMYFSQELFNVWESCSQRDDALKRIVISPSCMSQRVTQILERGIQMEFQIKHINESI